MAVHALTTGAQICVSGNTPEISTSSRRAFLGRVGSTAIVSAVGAISLTPSSWFERFDAEAWVERWYRAGHRIASGPDGQPLLWQDLDADEAHATALRGELGWPGNRAAVIRYLDRFEPASPGTVCGFARRAA